MKKQLFSLIITVICFLNAAAITDATLTPDFSPTQPIKYVFKNISLDTLTIESIMVTSSEVAGTVHLFVTNETGAQVRHIGKTASPLFHREILAPNTSRDLNFLFEKRIRAGSITVVIIARNECGERLVTICDHCIIEG